jgi:hypothetical protein
MTDLAAWLNQPRPPARLYPDPDGPDYERHDDRGDDYPAGLDWNTPIGWPR